LTNIKCIVGLGNPGTQYEATRHNIGFQIIQLLSTELKSPIKPGRGDFWIGETWVKENSVILVAPFTYMNDSGIAVKQIMEFYQPEISNILIVYDDFQLPIGTLRMRESGSDGGHNGMSSVIYQLQSESIPRLRVGIGGMTAPDENKKEQMAAYVLSPFENNEIKEMETMRNHARDACLHWITYGIQSAMNRFNTSFLSEIPKQ
jgi:peptidyl-tRNA hydrolase, PTH1 family